jgi:hypothetical protein
VTIPDCGLPDRFAHHFDFNIKTFLEGIFVDDQVFNGEPKIVVTNSMFMDQLSNKEFRGI